MRGKEVNVKDPIRLYVGIDWATEEHVVYAMDCDGTLVAERSFKHSGDGLGDLVTWLEQHSDGHPEEVAVAIEVPHGAIVDTLLERGCQVFAINPKQLDRFRDRFSPAGAKDDRRDAHVLADSLRTDQHCFRRLKVEEPIVLELREWSRMQEELVGEKVRLRNRLRDQLRRYFPQFIEVAGDSLGDDSFLDLWDRIPTPAEAKRVRVGTAAAILRKHRIRRISGGEIIEALRQKPLPIAPGVAEAAVAHIRHLADRIRIVNHQLRECERTLDALIERASKVSDGEDSDEKKEQPSDPEILLSMPGIGRIVLAALLAEASEPLRQRDYHALRSLSGVAPVTEQSGKQRPGTKRRPRVIMRRACHVRLRVACYHWARVAVQRDPVSRQHYSTARSRGHRHGRALRGVADRLLAVACSMLRHGELYDETRRRNPRPAA
jgi:transposase